MSLLQILLYCVLAIIVLFFLIKLFWIGLMLGIVWCAYHVFAVANKTTT